MYTHKQLIQMVERLVESGMEVPKAVRIVAQAYGVDPNQLLEHYAQ